MAFTPQSTDGNDVINGDNAGDSIFARAGNDLVSGSGGDDTLDGGDGNDKLLGGSGSDILYGQAGDDWLEGGEGPLDQLIGGSGNDTLIGGAGGNVLFGDDGDDVFIRGGLYSNLFGGAGYDVELVGGAGRRGAIFTAHDGYVSRDVGNTHDNYYDMEAIQYIDGRVVFDLNDPAAQIVRLYQSALGRGPDQEGLHYWATPLETNRATLADIANGFLVSDEYAARFGTALNDQSFVVRIYQNVLGRDPEQAGLDYWLSHLQNGASRSLVLSQISESTENITRTAPLIQAGVWDLSEHAAQVARLYDTTVGRLPDMIGLNYWREQLDAGTQDLQGIARGFVESNEFVARYGASATTSDFVELLYKNTLHREADVAGKAYWVSEIDGGAMTRADVVVGFSESIEHHVLTRDITTSENPSQFGILFAS